MARATARPADSISAAIRRFNAGSKALSLAATLNLGYHDDLAGFPTTNRLPLRRLIADNAVSRAFRNVGYRVVTFGSGFDASEVIEAELSSGILILSSITSRTTAA